MLHAPLIPLTAPEVTLFPSPTWGGPGRPQGVSGFVIGEEGDTNDEVPAAPKLGDPDICFPTLLVKAFGMPIAFPAKSSGKLLTIHVLFSLYSPTLKPIMRGEERKGVGKLTALCPRTPNLRTRLPHNLREMSSAL